MPTKPHFKLEDVDKLIHGKRSGKRIGSRGLGHHLSAFERDEYARASKRGFLTVNCRSRSNLWNVWQKVCLARSWTFLVLIKTIEPEKEAQGEVYQEDVLVFQGALRDAKKDIKSRVASFLA